MGVGACARVREAYTWCSEGGLQWAREGEGQGKGDRVVRRPRRVRAVHTWCSEGWLWGLRRMGVG